MRYVVDREYGCRQLVESGPFRPWHPATGRDAEEPHSRIRGQTKIAERSDPRTGPRGARPGGLSRREIDVLRLVAAGRTSGEIATELFISTRTAEHHIQNIYTKIGLLNRAAATRWAVTHRVVDDVLDG
jgi:DNA-binding CsgD family transcriptional regulator